MPTVKELKEEFNTLIGRARRRRIDLYIYDIDSSTSIFYDSEENTLAMRSGMTGGPVGDPTAEDYLRSVKRFDVKPKDALEKAIENLRKYLQ